MPNTHQNQLSEFRIRYGFHSRKYCPSLCSKTVQIDAPPIFLPSPFHSRISPRETGHPGPDGPPVERPGGYWIRSFRCATERVSTTKGGSLPFPGAGTAKPPSINIPPFPFTAAYRPGDRAPGSDGYRRRSVKTVINDCRNEKKARHITNSLWQFPGYWQVQSPENVFLSVL